jgi:hypothetical protein
MLQRIPSGANEVPSDWEKLLPVVACRVGKSGAYVEQGEQAFYEKIAEFLRRSTPWILKGQVGKLV